MDKSIKQALIELVPTLHGTIPAELIDLGTSLLVQSRGKASLLRADEEIARSYACANIACESMNARLKHSLGLPRIQPRPPCPPRVYQKLYKILDTTLLAGTKRSRDAPRLNLADAKSSPARPKAPTKLSAWKTWSAESRLLNEEDLTSAPLSLLKRQNSPIKSATIVSKVARKQACDHPKARAEPAGWAMAAIRSLCQRLDAPLAPHHVFAGVSSILALPPPTEPEFKAKQEHALHNQPALIMVVFLAVYARLAAEETPVGKFIYQQATGFEILSGFVGPRAAETEITQSKDFETLLLAFKESGWAQMDWFENITAGAGLGLDSNIRDGVGTALENGPATQTQSFFQFQDQFGVETDQLQAGLGTMMQDQLDYLTEKRGLNYQAWEKKVLVQIQELEQLEEMSPCFD